ncbi:MAG: helix-turn-helix transcriptional regulator [Tenericutes bacterium]|nr:helix-turn-helix transcriptional regulator [Mycoplasmatota bacterium]
MNTIEIGKYIKMKRVEMHLTQKGLADKLQISFQAVSKWETGTTLPDTSLLIKLSDILDVTVDQILNAGEFRKSMNKKIIVNDIVTALKSIPKLKEVLGPNNVIYSNMMSGLANMVKPDLETILNDKESLEILVAKSVIQLLIDGYYITDEEINSHFGTEGIRLKLLKVSKKYK